MKESSKIDSNIIKRFERKERKRKIEVRHRRVYFLIVCEGTKTEPNYFKAFEKLLPPYTLDVEIIGTAKNTSQVVEETFVRMKNSSKRYDSVWAVFDKDSFPNHKFDNAIAKGKMKDIKCAYSNEAFELWYILHFEFLNTGISRDDYQKHIERCLTQKTGKKFKYKKNDSNMFELLNEYGNQNQAIIWAKKLEKLHSGKKYHEHNPSTRVYALVEELNNPVFVLE